MAGMKVVKDVEKMVDEKEAELVRVIFRSTNIPTPNIFEQDVRYVSMNEDVYA
jgi:hypothetical protein